MTFWDRCQRYEDLLVELNTYLDEKLPTGNIDYLIRTFWGTKKDQKRAYEMYVVSRSPLPEHFAYLWES